MRRCVQTTNRPPGTPCLSALDLNPHCTSLHCSPEPWRSAPRPSEQPQQAEQEQERGTDAQESRRRKPSASPVSIGRGVGRGGATAVTLLAAYCLLPASLCLAAITQTPCLSLPPLPCPHSMLNALPLSLAVCSRASYSVPCSRQQRQQLEPPRRPVRRASGSIRAPPRPSL